MRKQKNIRITTGDTENRDEGKMYLLTEMPASKAEKWGIKALAALAAGNLDIPDDVAALGMAGVAAMGMQAFSGLDFEVIEPLLDEMMECVVACPDPSNPLVTRPLIEDDIEEISTRLMLRKEIFELHTGFFKRASLSTSTLAKPKTRKR